MPVFRNYLRSYKKSLQGAQGGLGEIYYARLFDRNEISPHLKFIDIIEIPPGSSIGYHGHKTGEVEIYCFIEGEAQLRINDQVQTATKGDVFPFGEHDCHEIVNLSQEQLLRILVVKISEGVSC